MRAASSRPRLVQCVSSRLVERLLRAPGVVGPLGEERGQQIDGLDAARGEVGEQLPLERVRHLTGEARERRAVAARRGGRALREDLRPSSGRARTGSRRRASRAGPEPDDGRDRVLVSALLAEIAAERRRRASARRTETRRCPPAPSRRPGRRRAARLSAACRGATSFDHAAHEPPCAASSARTARATGAVSGVGTLRAKLRRRRGRCPPTTTGGGRPGAARLSTTKTL